MQLHITWDRPCFFLFFFLEGPLLQKRPRWLRLYRSGIAWLSHVVLACVTLEVCATDFPHIGSRANTCCPWCILTPSLTQSAHDTHRGKHTYTCTHIPAHRRTHAPMTSFEIHKQAVSTRPNVDENLKHTQWKVQTYAGKKVPSQITKQSWVNTADRKLGAKQRMGFFWREIFF